MPETWGPPWCSCWEACVCDGIVKSVKSHSEPWVSAPIRSVSSVSRNVSVCELGPYASTLIFTAYTTNNNDASTLISKSDHKTHQQVIERSSTTTTRTSNFKIIIEVHLWQEAPCFFHYSSFVLSSLDLWWRLLRLLFRVSNWREIWNVSYFYRVSVEKSAHGKWMRAIKIVACVIKFYVWHVFFFYLLCKKEKKHYDVV